MKHFSDSEVFIECLTDMDDVHKDIKEYNPNKIQKIFILFDDMILIWLVMKKVIQ